MIRKAFVMSVNPGSEDEYVRRHSPIWDDLHAVLKKHGVQNYSIFLEPKTNQLFGYAEIESEEKWSRITETDECKRWWAYMKDLMPTNEDDSPMSTDLKEIFHID
jgi:L-rhamnose mutarotase